MTLTYIFIRTHQSIKYRIDYLNRFHMEASEAQDVSNLETEQRSQRYNFKF